MKRLFRRHIFRRTAVGQGLVEYALLLALIAVIVVGAVRALGNTTEAKFDQINCAVAGGQWRSDNGNGNSNRCK